MTASPFPRGLAIHEAAHSVTEIALGGVVEAVHLRTMAQVRSGNLITDSMGRSRDALGFCESRSRTDAAFWLHVYPSQRPDGLQFSRSDALKDMTTSAAGPIAEAKFSHRSINFEFLFGGGTSDWKAMNDVATLMNDRSLLDIAIHDAKRLVSSHWSTILAVADLIQCKPYTPGEVIHDVVERLLPVVNTER